MLRVFYERIPMNMRVSVFCFSLLMAGLCAEGQLPATTATTTGAAVQVHHSVSLDVQLQGSGGAGHSSNKTHDDTGKYTGVDGQALATSTIESKQTINHRTVLSIAVRNFSPQPDEVQLEWYFFAEPYGGSKTYILNSDVSKISLKGSETQNVTATSLETGVTTVQKATGAAGYEPILSRQTNGTKQKGWMVRVLADGKVIDVRGSDLTTEGYGKDDKALEALKKGAPPQRH